MAELCLLGIDGNKPFNNLVKYSYSAVMKEQLSPIMDRIKNLIGTIFQIATLHQNDPNIQLPKHQDIPIIEISPHKQAVMTDFIHKYIPDFCFNNELGALFYKLNGVYENRDGFQNKAEISSVDRDMHIKYTHLVALYNEMIRYLQTQDFYEQLGACNSFPCIIRPL